MKRKSVIDFRSWTMRFGFHPSPAGFREGQPHDWAFGLFHHRSGDAIARVFTTKLLHAAWRHRRRAIAKLVPAGTPARLVSA